MRARRGVVLAPVIVLLAMALLLALAFADRLRLADRAARLAWQGERALHAADAALLDALLAWPGDSAAALRVGETDSLPHALDPSMRTAVTRARLSAARYLLHAEAVVPVGASAVAVGASIRDRAERRLVRAVRLAWPRPPANAALIAFGDVSLEAGAVILGVDTEPAAWAGACSSDRRAEALPAVRSATLSADSTVALVGASPAWHVLAGADRDAAEAAFEQAWEALRLRATRELTDSVLDLDAPAAPGPCRLWFGDARRGAGTTDACTRQWPIVHARYAGATTLRGTQPGQGVLLVEGDLRVAPGAVLHGVVLVRGRLHVDAASATAPTELSGLVVVRDSGASGSRVEGGRIASGQCAARFALAAAGRPVPEHRRGWHERP